MKKADCCRVLSRQARLMPRRESGRLRSSSLMLAVTALTSCTINTEDTLSITQGASVESDATPERFWDTPGSVNICFTGPADEDPVETAHMDKVEQFLLDYWQPSMGLTLEFKGICPTSTEIPSEWISTFLNWRNGGTGNGQAHYGIGARLKPKERIDNRTDIQVYLGAPHHRGNVLHEFGHAFGLKHEFERADMNFECGSSDPGDDVVGMTANDSSSISNYTSCGAGTVPSTLDLLAIEILYPKDAELPVVCKEACFAGSDGVFLRTNGYAQDSWTGRGAWPWWSSEQQLTWNSSSHGLITGGSELSANNLGEGAHNVNYQGRTKFSGKDIEGSGQVVVSDAKWTAISMTIL